MEDYSPEFDLQKLIGELMSEIIRLKAESTVNRELISQLYRSVHSELSHESFDNMYRKSFSEMLDQLRTSHEWFEGYWKQILHDLDQ